MRLLCVNLNYIGDALFTTAALGLLKGRLPEARIDVLAGKRAAAILEGNPSIERLILRPPHGGSGRALALAQTLRSGKYDAVVLFQSTLANAFLAWRARVPVRVGFAREGCGPMLTHVVPSRYPAEHDVDAYLRVANAAVRRDGTANPVDPRAYRLSIALSPDDAAFAESFFRAHEVSPPVVGLVIGTTRPQKRWPEEYFARLADKLWNAAKVSCVLLGGPEEAEVAQRILSLTRGAPVVSAIGKTTEKQLAGVIARLSVVVSGDSGPLHVATAMTVPTVGLFGSTDPADTGPWTPTVGGAPSTVLYDALFCAPCRKNPTCNGRFDCMRGLTPDRVFDAVAALIDLPDRRLSLPMAAPIFVGGDR